MAANDRLKVTKNTFYHKYIYIISFHSAVIHSTSFTIKIDFNYFPNGLHSEKKKKRNDDSQCALAHSLLCWNAALWNRKRPHADKIIEFWFVILKMIAARSVFDITVCGWEYISGIIVIHRPWYHQLTNHFQIVKYFSFFPMIHWLAYVISLFIFLLLLLHFT